LQLPVFSKAVIIERLVQLRPGCFRLGVGG